MKLDVAMPPNPNLALSPPTTTTRKHFLGCEKSWPVPHTRRTTRGQRQAKRKLNGAPPSKQELFKPTAHRHFVLPSTCIPVAGALVVRPPRLPPEFSWRTQRSSPPRRRPPSRRPRSRTMRGSQHPRLGPLFPAADFLLGHHPRLVVFVVPPLVPTGGGGGDSRSAVGAVFRTAVGKERRGRICGHAM